MSQNSRPCLKCGKLGIEQSGDILPNTKSMLIKVIHDDGSNPCEFEEYVSLPSFMSSRNKSKDPKIMDCPVCGKSVRVGWYRPNKNKKYHRWLYYIVHEQIEGYWGKTKVRKRRRCYTKTEDQRNKILNKLVRLQI